MATLHREERDGGVVILRPGAKLDEPEGEAIVAAVKGLPADGKVVVSFRGTTRLTKAGQGRLVEAYVYFGEEAPRRFALAAVTGGPADVLHTSMLDHAFPMCLDEAAAVKYLTAPPGTAKEHLLFVEPSVTEKAPDDGGGGVTILFCDGTFTSEFRGVEDLLLDPFRHPHMGPHAFVLDLSGVRDMDAAAVGALVHAKCLTFHHRDVLTLVGIPERVDNLLARLWFNQSFDRSLSLGNAISWCRLEIARRTPAAS